MNITILAVGSRGDVQPYVALAQGLQAAGHTVKVAAGTNFEGFVRGQGVDYAPLRADYYALMDSPEGQALKSGNPMRVMQHMKTIVFPLMRRLLDDTWAAAKNADALIYHPKALSGLHLAEALGIPAIAAIALPIVAPTSAFPAPGLPLPKLGGFFNRLTYKLVDAAAASFGGMIQEWRQSIGLSATSNVIQGMMLRGQPVPVLYFYSQYVIPRPADWPPSVHVTGYWFLKDRSGWIPPDDLVRFLAEGPAPVYVGFGSMVAENAESFTRTVIEGIQQAGVRAVLATGWGGLRASDLPASIFRLQEAPHDWLFPQMAAVAHHGGAGTTGAGLRAGKPTVIVPFIADQPFWGQQVEKLGVGPAPIPQKRMTAAALAAALKMAVTNSSMRERALQLGERIRTEDGVGEAVRVIQQVLGAPEPKLHPTKS
ncbi:MAG: glycosyltransferase family 1 protein [Anaerolineae bacterium]|nr:glycosyltransferase family 1 protein [Anaerolineae bacterium]